MRLIAAFVLIAPFVQATPQKAPPPTNPLASAKTLKCSFTAYAAVRWDKNPLQVLSDSQDFSFQIDAIDQKKKRAIIVGSGGATGQAAIALTETGLNVIETTPGGNLNLTTVFVGDGKGPSFRAAHSRHLGDSSGAPRVSQNYGSCEVVK
jgi:hypothetical protein